MVLPLSVSSRAIWASSERMRLFALRDSRWELRLATRCAAALSMMPWACSKPSLTSSLAASSLWQGWNSWRSPFIAETRKRTISLPS